MFVEHLQATMIAKCVTLAVLFGLSLGNDYECGDDSLVKIEKGKDVPSKLPWAVILKIQGMNNDHVVRPAILISDTEILTYGYSNQRGGWVQIFTDRKQMIEHALIDVPGLPARTIKDPVWEPFNMKFSVLKLKKPLKLSKSVTPICLSETKPNDVSGKLFFYWEDNIRPGETIKTVIHRLYIKKEPTKGYGLFATYKSNGRWYFDEKASRYRPSN